jgi:hypothetical protein
MEEENPQLVLDEELFLTAIRTLADLEEEEQPFELLHAVTPFAKSGYVAARFAVDIGRDIEIEEIRAIDYYVAAVYLVYHRKGSIEDLGEVFEEIAPPVATFVRTAAWAFLSAWNFRYGGVWADRVVRGTLVDPRPAD